MTARRGAVRLYSDFAQSDIVVASPLALATFLSETAGKEREGGADFLSSIEVVVVERADVVLMQNWAHVTAGAPPPPGPAWHAAFSVQRKDPEQAPAFPAHHSAFAFAGHIEGEVPTEISRCGVRPTSRTSPSSERRVFVLRTGILGFSC